MIEYALKRIVSGLLLVAGLMIVTFFLVRLSPGNPAAIAFDPTRSVDAMSRLENAWGLDKPLLVQFGAWISSIFHGDFGVSYANHRTVVSILKETVPNTLALTLPALFFQLLFGIALGVMQILNVNSWIDRLTSISTLVLYAVPSFWIGILLIMLFSQKLGWLPSSQMISFTANDLPFWSQMGDRIAHAFLPVSTMVLASLGITSRYIRNGLAGIMDQTFIMAARAQGFGHKEIVMRHALKNTLVPVITITGQHIPALISSSVIIELVFSWPGMGRLMINSAFARDYPVIIACTFLMSLFVVLGTLIADLISAMVDPRIQTGRI